MEDHSDPSTNSPWHGTSCGGIIGSSKNNVCGVGIAYEANLGGKERKIMCMQVFLPMNLC